MCYQDDYLKYRGKCKEFSEALILERPELTLVRGHYFEPTWGRDEAHWWCVDPEGTIVDPTAKQFPSGGVKELYTEFDGVIFCEQCEEQTTEDTMVLAGRYPCCSEACALRLVGL